MLRLAIIFVFYIFQSTQYSGIILSVIDGDTFILQTTDGNLKIRMDGIDAPEKDQVFGKESKDFLNKYLYKKCIVKTNGIDRYGRMIGTLYIDEININLLSVQEGYSWHYKKYSNNEDLAKAESNAKENKKGLWRYLETIPPWEWRRKEE